MAYKVKKKPVFIAEPYGLPRELQKKNATAKTPYEIPRGVDIEHLYYKIAKGYTDEQYSKYLESYD